MFKKILVPLDGSRFASRALKYSIEIAHSFDAEIILMQVEKPTTPISVSDGPQPGIQSPAAAKVAVQIALDEDKRNLSKARSYLSRKVREVKGKKLACSYHVTVGDPAESIILYARKKKIDLIIMTSHGKGGIVRAVMGSVADEVIRNSGKPVLVIRPNKHSEK
jgi:nucleotide-binding universal stress UspA family protein